MMKESFVRKAISFAPRGRDVLDTTTGAGPPTGAANPDRARVLETSNASLSACIAAPQDGHPPARADRPGALGQPDADLAAQIGGRATGRERDHFFAFSNRDWSGEASAD